MYCVNFLILLLRPLGHATHHKNNLCQIVHGVLLILGLVALGSSTKKLHYSNTMIASVSFVLTRNLISNFPQTGQISNPPINMHEQTSNFQKNLKQC